MTDNNITTKHPGGRPPLWTDPAELESRINEYFDHCDKGEEIEEISKRGELIRYTRKIPYTYEELSLYLGCDPRTIRNYGKTDEFFPVLSRARRKIQASWIKRGLSGDYNPKMAALILAANNKDYRITQEVNHVSSTVEGILQRLAQGAAPARIDHQPDDETPDAEVVE